MSYNEIERTEFLYYYSKYFVSTLVGITIGEESWYSKDIYERYRESVTSGSEFRKHLSASKKLSNLSDFEKNMKGISISFLQEAKEKFYDVLEKDLDAKEGLYNMNIKNLKSEIKCDLMNCPKMSFVEYVKKIREKECSHLENKK